MPDEVTDPTGAPEGAPTSTETGVPATGAPESSSSAPAPTGDSDPFESGADSFDRAYVEKLRNEAAKYRTDHKPFRDTFDGYTPEQTEYLLSVVEAIRTDPTTAAAELQAILEVINGEAEEPDPAGDPEADRPLTYGEWQKLTEEREKQAQLDQDLKSLDEELEALGYKPGSRDYYALLWTAQNETNFDVKAAHEALQKAEAEKYEAFVARKKAEAEQDPTAAGAAGSAPDHSKTPKDWASARASMEARLSRS